MFNDKILMITGGTGSFGSAVLERLLKEKFKEIRIFSRDELKQELMRHRFKSNKLKFFIGDVRDHNSVKIATKGVDFIFHAAALKQVPSCEFYPEEAYKTNVVGTQNIMNAAIENNVKKCVLLSTDKAVYPVNAMGVSKAMAEKLLIAKARFQEKGNTVFCITRYGNVMCSRGSVIPLFISQIKAKRHMTITDPKMTRFLMSLENSVELVLHAIKNGQQGDIFVKKSPSSTIIDLAVALKELFNSKCEIKVIGTRHGEKLFETLVSREEIFKSKETAKYFKISMDNRDLNYSKYFSKGEEDISNLIDYTSENTKLLNVDEIKNTLLSLDYVKEELNV